jgi:hypothetical protein
MNTKRKLQRVLFCLIAAGALTSCGNDTLVGDTPKANDKAVVLTIQKGYAEDSLTRSVQQPITKRIILADGLLVDATLVDEGNMPHTRTTTFEPITQGTGMAFVCSGNTIVRKQDITVSDEEISVMVPGTGTYTVYLYLNEDSNLGLADATIPDNDVTHVTLANRTTGMKDDYAKVSDISASSDELESPVTFTPLGSELRLTVNAGVTPLTGFETTLNSIQSDQATNIYVANGACTISSTPGTALSLAKDNGSTGYATSLTSNNVRFFSLNQTAQQTAVLTINSISGPDGGTAPTTKKTYTTANTMNFTTVYANGHRYNLILNLATPITGGIVYDASGAATGVSGATWPVLNGVPDYFEWDAKAPYQRNGAAAPSTSLSYWHNGVTAANPASPGTNVATFSSRLCPSYNQITWYMSAGIYWDKSRWYCPTGFGNGSVKVYSGGCWLKKASKIPGFSNSAPTAVGLTSENNQGYNTNNMQTGKPGIVKLNSTDVGQQNPNEWYYLPAADDWRVLWTNTDSFTGSQCNYWSSTPYSTNAYSYMLRISNNLAPKVGLNIYHYSDRSDGWCNWTVQ